MAIYSAERIVKNFSIDASGSISDTISPDFLVKKVNISSGADVSTTVTFAGKEYNSSFVVDDDFGASCQNEIEISASNSGTEAESLTIEILGYRQARA